jgi:hypothetical protein
MTAFQGVLDHVPSELAGRPNDADLHVPFSLRRHLGHPLALEWLRDLRL